MQKQCYFLAPYFDIVEMDRIFNYAYKGKECRAESLLPVIHVNGGLICSL